MYSSTFIEQEEEKLSPYFKEVHLQLQGTSALSSLPSQDDVFNEIISHEVVESVLDEWDPRHEAVLEPGTIVSQCQFFNRRVLEYSSQLRIRNQLENKAISNTLFSSLGLLDQCPIVACHDQKVVSEACLVYHSDFVNGGTKLVLSGCMSGGKNTPESVHDSGGNGVKIVRNPAEAEAAALQLNRVGFSHVRICEFFHGISVDLPCVLFKCDSGPNKMQFLPEENLVLKTSSGSFIWLGQSSWWTPEEAHKAVFDAVLDSVCRALHKNYNFVGAFEVNGVLTEDNHFFPSEINARSGGLSTDLFQDLHMALDLAAILFPCPKPEDVHSASKVLLHIQNINRALLKGNCKPFPCSTSVLNALYDPIMADFYVARFGPNSYKIVSSDNSDWCISFASLDAISIRPTGYKPSSDNQLCMKDIEHLFSW
eukprot:CAMPEP_0183795878 /NCGR_PEP_ID=MMETSP0803_2-20130417/5368_1 /TAXON_ID=195967 /ORGANISM="Crustomastix stigmata, Strain CCMP3273" /LENGTH=424 /DNA_ID=CAMNT_0026040385 /DNA_START=345 /DNA_END=1616 /DNA_ORIENTATION=-